MNRVCSITRKKNISLYPRHSPLSSVTSKTKPLYLSDPPSTIVLRLFHPFPLQRWLPFAEVIESSIAEWQKEKPCKGRDDTMPFPPLVPSFVPLFHRKKTPTSGNRARVSTRRTPLVAYRVPFEGSSLFIAPFRALYLALTETNPSSSSSSVSVSSSRRQRT